MNEALKNFLLSIRKELSENNRKILDRMLISDEEQIARLKLIAESWLGALDRDVAVSVFLHSEDYVKMADVNYADNHYEFYIPRAMSFNDAELEILDNILQASLFYTDNLGSAQPWQRNMVRDIAALLLKLERNV